MNTAIILILGIPLVEIYLFIKVGSQIGALNTILLILFTFCVLINNANILNIPASSSLIVVVVNVFLLLFVFDFNIW